jgi:beta-galactosidase
VLVVKLDNRTNYQERATSTSFEWNANDFNPDFGGINSHVWLHVTGKIRQTLPLYYGLESQGVYIYACNFEIARKTAATPNPNRCGWVRRRRTLPPTVARVSCIPSDA